MDRESAGADSHYSARIAAFVPVGRSRPSAWASVSLSVSAGRKARAGLSASEPLSTPSVRRICAVGPRSPFGLCVACLARPGPARFGSSADPPGLFRRIRTACRTVSADPPLGAPCMPHCRAGDPGAPAAARHIVDRLRLRLGPPRRRTHDADICERPDRISDPGKRKKTVTGFSHCRNRIDNPRERILIIRLAPPYPRRSDIRPSAWASVSLSVSVGRKARAGLSASEPLSTPSVRRICAVGPRSPFGLCVACLARPGPAHFGSSADPPGLFRRIRTASRTVSADPPLGAPCMPRCCAGDPGAPAVARHIMDRLRLR